MNTILEKPDQLFTQSPSFLEYQQMIEKLVEQGKTTGPKQTETYVEYTRQNVQRVKRVLRTTRISEEVQSFLEQLKGTYHWLVITEGWCGDAAATVPVMHLLAEQSEKITLRTTLRDEHPGLIDQFLTNGGRSIPVLIVMDADSGEVLGNWKPRPQELQQMMLQMKQDGVPWDDIVYDLQKWYAKDRGKSTIREIAQLMQEIETARF